MLMIKIIYIYRRLRKAVAISGICGIWGIFLVLSTSMYFKIIYSWYEGIITKQMLWKIDLGEEALFRCPCISVCWCGRPGQIHGGGEIGEGGGGAVGEWGVQASPVMEAGWLTSREQVLKEWYSSGESDLWRKMECMVMLVYWCFEHRQAAFHWEGFSVLG